jgi:hypothetical protein
MSAPNAGSDCRLASKIQAELMWKAPDPSRRTLFSTEWILDERSAASDIVRVYALGMRDLRLFRNRAHARLALIAVEKNLWKSHPHQCAIATLSVLIYGGLLLAWGLPFARQFLHAGAAEVVVSGLWIVTGWLLFCMVIRPAIVVELRKTVVAWRFLCGRCGYDLRGHKHEHCPECGAAVTATGFPPARE